MRGKKRLTAVLTAALIGGTAAVANGSPPGAGAAPLVATGPGAGSTVPLVTGDSVVVDGARVHPVAGNGRNGVSFSIRRYGGHTYVIPSDAAPLVVSGKLDQRLFDVTLLDQQGYDEEAQIPLIVQGKTGLRAAETLAGIGAEVLQIPTGTSDLWNSVVGPRASRSSVEKIWLDAKLQLLTDHSVPQIGAPEAWQAGYTGKGVKVAVIDGGIDETHPELTGQVVAAKDFTSEGTTDDLSGHGTHVASTVASKGDKYRGVAPDAQLLNGKVCTADGRCSTSALLKALEWASTEQKAKVVNLSQGGPDMAGVDPIEQAINTLTEKNGTLFVVAAGNTALGGAGTVTSPATADAALAVGAVDREDSLASFSSQGPRNDGAVKPDLTAPGAGIVAAKAKNGFVGEPVDATHVAASGTSMSSPHVAGAAALLFEQHPDWTPAQVKAALMGSAKPTDGLSSYQQGAGRVDLSQAIKNPVIAEQPSLGFGKPQWPHEDDEPVAQKLTYRNFSDKDVTLALKQTATGPDGKPSTVFGLSADSVTVPANGTASVEVIADTRGNDLVDGAHSGVVLASGDGVSVRTPIGVIREVESYDVTVNVVGRDGKPASDYAVHLSAYDGTYLGISSDPSDVARFRVPPGQYVLDTDITNYRDPGGDETKRTADWIIAPWLDVKKAKTVTVDARKAKPAPVTVDRKDASAVWSSFGFTAFDPDGGMFMSGVDTADLTKLGVAQIGPDAPRDRFAGMLQSVLGVPGADGSFENSPYTYNLAWFTGGKPYTGARRVRDSELASVRTEHLPQGKGDFGIKGALATSTEIPGAEAPGWGLFLPMSLPHTSEELFTTNGVAWMRQLAQGERGEGLPEDINQTAYDRTYKAGRKYTERWNGGSVFGPSLPGNARQANWAEVNSRIGFNVPLFGQAADTEGQSKTDSIKTVVLRDGQQVYETDKPEFRLSAVKGQYEISTSATRSNADTSTRIESVWRFAYDGESPAALPVQVVRFTPKLDAANSAPGGKKFTVPVAVQQNPGSAETDVESLTVEVSYDDGANWTQAPVAGGKVTLDHPDSGYVSLRAKAVDTAGNEVEQTILRAYRLS